ncbi:MAG TPA: hypothetical protein VIJ25_16365 [Methylococcales bacterium]
MLNKVHDILRTDGDRNAIPSAIPTKSWAANSTGELLGAYLARNYTKMEKVIPAPGKAL